MSDDTEHLGTKLSKEAERLGLKPKQLAEHFGMKTPSIYDTLKFGRLDKRHYQALVDLNGKTLEWWFDVVPPPGTPSATNYKQASTLGAVIASENAPQAYLQPNAELNTLFAQLPKSEQSALIEQLREKVKQLERLYKELKERQL